MMPAVSIIIPVYKVERYITRCASSLFAQTLKDLEFIFVDDASPDESIGKVRECLKLFPKRKEQVKILVHEKNKGLPAARNTGLSEATGKYIYHCDSDDYLESDALERMLSTAEVNSADFLWSDWFLTYENSERLMRQPDYGTNEELIRGFFRGKAKYNVWNKLVRKTLYDKNGIRFPEGHSMGEDMTMIRLACCAGKIVHLSIPTYHYIRFNGEAMTQNYTNRQFEDIRFNLQQTCLFLKEKNFPDIEKESGYFKLYLKYPLLITDNVDSYKSWHLLFPEADRYIMEDNGFGFRMKLLQWFASKRWYMMLRLYYMIGYRFIYKTLYMK